MSRLLSSKPLRRQADTGQRQFELELKVDSFTIRPKFKRKGSEDEVTTPIDVLYDLLMDRKIRIAMQVQQQKVAAKKRVRRGTHL